MRPPRSVDGAAHISVRARWSLQRCGPDWSDWSTAPGARWIVNHFWPTSCPGMSGERTSSATMSSPYRPNRLHRCPRGPPAEQPGIAPCAYIPTSRTNSKGASEYGMPRAVYIADAIAESLGVSRAHATVKERGLPWRCDPISALGPTY